jgi:hypothetical protein
MRTRYLELLRIMDRQRIRSKAKWFLSEILVVVVGVLLAIWLNAFYSEIQTRKEESRYLTSLAADFDKTIDGLQTAVDSTDYYKNNIIKILRLANGPRSEHAGQEIENRMVRAFMMASFPAVMGTYKELVSDDKLDIISDESLRSSLVEFETSLETLSDVWDEGWEQYNLTQAPYSIKNLNSLRIFSRYKDSGFPASANPANHQVYWTTEFSNLLAVTAVSRIDQLDVGRKVLADARLIRTQIESSR